MEIQETVFTSIKTLGEKYQAEKILLFGSRARGDNRERSDIDLAIYGMEADNRTLFWLAVEDLPTLLKFDIVHIDKNTEESFLKTIEAEGVVLYEKNY